HCECLEQDEVAFHRIEVSHGHDHGFIVDRAELPAHRIATSRRHEPDGVADDLNPAFRLGEPCQELRLTRLGYGDDGVTVPECPAEGHSPPPRLERLLAAMHGDHGADSHHARCRRAVDRHRELVAVRDFDVPLAEDSDEAAEAAQVERPPQVEGVGVESRFPELASEPTAAVRGTDEADRVTPAAELLGELEHHRLRTTGTITLEKEGNSSHLSARELDEQSAVSPCAASAGRGPGAGS